MEQNAQLLTERRERVLLLTLSNPQARNALHPDFYLAGLAAMQEAAVDAAIGAVVLTGAGEHFCAGGNLNRLRENREKPVSVQHESIRGLHQWILAMVQCPKPIIAAVEGAAAGAGFSLALACDLIVCALDARFVAAYVKVGLSPDGGLTHSLGRTLPPQLAKEILLEGAAIGPQRLCQLGVVNKLCGRGEALASALEWAAKLANGPTRAMARIKRLANTASENPIEAQLALERESFVESLFDAECGEGIAAFLEKRPPKFRDA